MIEIIFRLAFIGYAINNLYQMGKIYYPKSCSSDDCFFANWNSLDNFYITLNFLRDNKVINSIENENLEPKSHILKANISFASDIRINEVIYLQLQIKDKKNQVLNLYKFSITQVFLPNLQVSSYSNEILRPTNHILNRLDLSIMREPFDFDKGYFLKEYLPFTKVFQTKNKISYSPIFHVDLRMQNHEDFTPIYEFVENPKALEISINYVSIGNMNMRCFLTSAFNYLGGKGAKKSDFNELKEFLLGKEFHILMVFMIINILKVVISLFGIDGEIEFGNSINYQNLLQPLTYFWGAISSWIIFLYLFEEESSLIIKIPAFFTAAQHLINIVLRKYGGYVYMNIILDRKIFESEVKYAKLSRKLFIPIFIGICAYCYNFTPITSHYSWCIQILVRFVYAVGFIMMLQPLYVNYSIKKVNRVGRFDLGLKGITTIADVIFMFLLRVPLLHKISFMRNFTVYSIYLIQRLMYKEEHLDRKKMIEAILSKNKHIKTD